jgi:hypothetical protein
MLRKLNAPPVTGYGTYEHMGNGAIVPVVVIDDQTGEIYVAGQKCVTPSASAARRHSPTTGDCDGANQTFTFDSPPSNGDYFLLIWNGMVMGPNDYELSGAVVTTEFTPQLGDTLYAFY